jgi:hypothetical protein
MRQHAMGLTFPARYRRFLASGEHRQYRALEMGEGYLVGRFRLDFTDQVLRDPQRLGELQGIERLANGWLDFRAEFPGLVPLSTLVDPELDGPDADACLMVKSFLVIDARDPACPVAIWDEDGARTYPLADSLDDFLAGRPTRRAVEFRPRFRLSAAAG